MGKADKDDSAKKERAPPRAFVDKAQKKISELNEDLYEDLKTKNQTTALAGQELADFNRVKELKPKRYIGGCCCESALLGFDNALITSIIKYFFDHSCCNSL